MPVVCQSALVRSGVCSGYARGVLGVCSGYARGMLGVWAGCSGSCSRTGKDPSAMYTHTHPSASPNSEARQFIFGFEIQEFGTN